MYVNNHIIYPLCSDSETRTAFNLHKATVFFYIFPLVAPVRAPPGGGGEGIIVIFLSFRIVLHDSNKRTKTFNKHTRLGRMHANVFEKSTRVQRK